MAKHVTVTLLFAPLLPCQLAASSVRAFRLRHATSETLTAPNLPAIVAPASPAFSPVVSSSPFAISSNTTLQQFPQKLAMVADQCGCHFRGLCSCSAALEFMSCISDACNTGLCACHDTVFLDSCLVMDGTCPAASLHCEAHTATCNNLSVLSHAKLRKEASIPEKWFGGLFWTTLAQVCIALLAALLYNRFRLKLVFEKHDQANSGVGFEFGLFSCFDDLQTSLLACCCGHVRWADTLDKAVGHRHDQPPLLNYWVGISFCLIMIGLRFCISPKMWVVAVCADLAFLIVCVFFRQQLRRRYSIPAGSIRSYAEDCFTYCCCSCCALVQEARHVEAYRSRE
eukprot:TRINITY_DN54709_c0_g1_i1.p1 TRINITY_DN54709_c0_g1~~TRINITY_DN54709_c0_g1_i1.p1  ORF type:complete len:360 (-),score=40.29 TRINITY_DN54709_c0_g1_i1:87-1109(-)